MMNTILRYFAILLTSLLWVACSSETTPAEESVEVTHHHHHQAPGTDLSEGALTEAATTEAEKPSEVITITIQNMKFVPDEIEVSRGSTVRWVNQDIIAHTATEKDSWDSGELNQGDSWEHSFDESGEYPYICTFHPVMTGKVWVK